MKVKKIAKAIEPISVSNRNVNASLVESKGKGHDQELIQSQPTSYPQYQKGKKDTHKI